MSDDNDDDGEVRDGNGHLEGCALFDPSTAKRGGPAKVNSKAFADGWIRIFGGKQEVGDA